MKQTAENTVVVGVYTPEHRCLPPPALFPQHHTHHTAPEHPSSHLRHCPKNYPNRLKLTPLVRHRSPCLPAIVDKFTQAPGYLNQRVFSDISSLEPYGWNDIVRSVVCLDQAACNVVQMDERKAGPWNLEAYWVDVKNLEKPVWV